MPAGPVISSRIGPSSCSTCSVKVKKGQAEPLVVDELRQQRERLRLRGELIGVARRQICACENHLPQLLGYFCVLHLLRRGKRQQVIGETRVLLRRGHA